MDQDKRDELISFCVRSEACLNDVHESEVDSRAFSKLSDEKLIREADWYNEMLDK